VATLKIYVDTREPQIIKRVARRLGFTPLAMEVGDYGTDKIIFERKKIGDLIASCYPKRYGEKARLQDQAERIYKESERRNIIPVLLITGNLKNHVEMLKEKCNVTINKNAVYGSVASVFVRYGIHIFWTEQPIGEWLREIRSICVKVDEGKYLLERRKPLHTIARNKQVANISRALEVSPRLAGRLHEKYGGLYGVLSAIKFKPSDVLSIDGIGNVTMKRMKILGGC
jgi:ERCC4-type nuclease